MDYQFITPKYIAGPHGLAEYCDDGSMDDFITITRTGRDGLAQSIKLCVVDVLYFADKLREHKPGKK